MIFKHMLFPIWMFLITILSAHTICATTHDITDTPDKTNAHISAIPSIEYTKIQEISESMTHMSKQKETDKTTQYIYDELAKAVLSKYPLVVDFLLDLNFESLPHILTTPHIACILGISAARGHPEDLPIIKKILSAKRKAFDESCQIDRAQQYRNEMTDLLNKTLAFSASQRHRNIVLHILTQDTHFDVNGINWALRNAMCITNISIRHQIIGDLYQHSRIKPSLSGTSNALDMAINSNNDSDWLNILELDIAHNGHTIEDILSHTTLGTRTTIVTKLVDRMLSGTCPTHLEPDVKSKILAIIKLQGRHQDEVIYKIKYSQKSNPIRFDCICESSCDLIKHIFNLCEKECEQTTQSSHLTYLQSKDCFTDNIFPLLLAKTHNNKHYTLPAETYVKLKKLCDYMLINSSIFGDYQTGLDLLDEKYDIFFDQQIIRMVADKLNSDVHTTPEPQTRKRKKKKTNDVLMIDIMPSRETFSERLIEVWSRF